MFERAVTSGVSALEWTHVVVASRDAICAQRQIFLLPTPWFSVDLPFFSFFHLGELSLTLLSLVFGWVNPFLSGTHAAPVHHCIAQNARVQLCSRARQQGESRQEHGLDAHEQTHTHTRSIIIMLYGGFGVSPASIPELLVNLITARSAALQELKPDLSESAFCTGTGTLTFHSLQLWAELLTAV